MVNTGKNPAEIAVVGDEPEALLFTVLCAEAGIPSYLVGAFRDEDRRNARLTGIDEALWLLQIHKRSGRISLQSDIEQLPLSSLRTLVIVGHPTNPQLSNVLEMKIRKLAPHLTPGTQISFAGIVRPRFTSSIFKATLEKYTGLKVGIDIGLSYIPLHWTGERLQEFRERPKVVASCEGPLSSRLQEDLLAIFPAITKASTVELAEAAGLFSALSGEVISALRLDLAKMSERLGVDFGRALDLCNGTGSILEDHSTRVLGRESIGANIVLSSSTRREGSRLIRAAHRVNEDYQAQVMEMIGKALKQCGQRLRRSKVAILGTEGLLRNSWAKPEPPRIIEKLQSRGVQVSFCPSETGGEAWRQLVGNHARVESNLLRAASSARCVVVALPKSAALELDASQLALVMDSPGAICDLSEVLEASNVERAGLFYTSIGRGTLVS